LCESRSQAVPGDGPENATLLFVGEAPGLNEDLQGKPFVGQAGNFLNKLLDSIGMAREEVFITNVVKCRPPENREPAPQEIEACRPYLERQIELMKPRMIVTLGRHSLEWFFPGEKISNARGKPRKVRGIIIYPIFHPAAALHQPKWRKTIEEDFQQIPKVLQEADKIEELKEPPKVEQLGLF